MGVLFHDSYGKIRDANPAAENMLGYSIAALQKTSLETFFEGAIHANGEPYPAEELPPSQCLKTGQKVKDHVAGITHPNTGKRIWLKITAIPEFQDGGEKPYRIITTLQEVTESYRLQRDLHENKEKFRKLTESTSAAILLYQDDYWVYANAAAEQISGYSAEKLKTMKYWEFAAPEYKSMIKNIGKKRQQGLRADTGYELRIITNKGKEKWVYLQGTSTELNDRPAGLISVIEITERKYAEEALKENEENLKITLDSIGDAVIATNLEGRVVRMNQVAETLTGYSFKEAAGKSLADIFRIVNAQSGRPVKSPVNEVLQTGKTVGLANHTKLIAKDGTNFQIADSAAPIKTPEGDIRGVVLVFRDVTEAYRIRQHLQESERFKQYILEVMPNLLYIYDLEEDKNIFVNQEISNYLGYSPDEGQLPRPQLTKKLMHPEDLERFRSHIAEIHELSDGQSCHFEYRMKTTENKWKWFSSHDTVFKRNEKGGVKQILGIATDITEKKHAEQALQESEERFKLAVEGTQDGLWDWNMITQEIYYSRQFGRILGYETEELKALGENISGLIHPDDRDAAFKKLEDYLAQKTDYYEATTRMKNKAGEYRWIRSRAKCQFDDSGKPVRLVGFISDITARKRAKKELERQKLLFEQVLTASSVAFTYIIDRKIIWANKAAEEMFGYSKEEYTNKDVRFLFPTQEAYEKVGEAIYQAGQGQSLIQHDIQLLSKNGTPIWVHEKVNVLKPSDPKEGLIISLIDITSRKKAEVELQKAQKYIENIIDSMPSVLIGIAPDGTVTQWNAEASRLTGLKPEEALEKPLNEAFPQLADESENIRRAINNRKPHKAHKKTLQVNGDTRYTDITIYPLVENGTGGVVIRVDDITEKVRLEEMMIQSEKMLSVGGLAAGMAHEINNPLGGMMQTADVLLDRLTNHELPANKRAAAEVGISAETIAAYMEKRGIPRMVRRLKEAGSRAAGIVQNMLSFARKSDKSHSTHNLKDLMEQTLELAGTDYDLKKNYDFRRIAIEREYEEHLPEVPCETGKIQQVFLNILRNAAEAMQELKTQKDNTPGSAPYQPRFVIRMAHEPDNRMVNIEIADNGPGMDEQTRRRIFEPFFTTKPTNKGTGLGLSVSYFIITENHNGSMHVESRPGEGTTFFIKLPAGTAG